MTELNLKHQSPNDVKPVLCAVPSNKVYLEDVYMYPSEILIALSGKLSDEDRYTWALTLIEDLEDALEITIEALDPSKREVTLKDIIQKYNPYLREDLLK